MKIVYFLLIFASGCASIKTPTPPPEANSLSVNVSKQFPTVMPKGSARFEETQLFFVHADQASEFAASLLVPIPFVTDAIIDSSKNKSASEFKEQYSDISAFEITLEELKKFDKLTFGEGGYNLYPMVFIEECYDDLYRLSLAYQLELGDWFGRYYYHLPTTIPKQDIGSPSQEELQNIGRDLKIGARQLLELIKQDISGNLSGIGKKVTVGSLYIVGSKVGGITTPMLMRYKNAVVVQETDTTIVVKIPGAPKAEAKAGGMAYGTHFFEKNQLHTLTEEE